MDPELVIFAIESAVKLGRKIYSVLVDETAERPLLLPIGELHANVAQNEAVLFFARPENAHLIGRDGPYFGCSAEERLIAYKTLLHLTDRLDLPPAGLRGASEAIAQIHAFRQLAPGAGAKSPAQRIIGTVFEIGVDYFAAHPESLSKNSAARKVLHSFLEGVDETDFAEGAPMQIVGDVLGAALHTVGNNPDWTIDDRYLAPLLGGIASALAQELEEAAEGSAADQWSATRFFERMSAAVVRGGLAAFNENLNVFLPTEGAARALVSATVAQVLGGIRGNEDFFNAATLELIFKSALGAAAENAELFTKNNFLQKLIARTLEALAAPRASELFPEGTVGIVLASALEVVCEHAETLLDPQNTQEHLLAFVIEALAENLGPRLAGDTKQFLSRRHLLQLVRVLFNEVASHPEQWVDGKDSKRTALAQMIGSVASALGEEPLRFVSGATFVELVQVLVPVVANNAEKLLDSDSTAPHANVLLKALQQIVRTVLERGDTRKLVTRQVFLEIVERVLPLVSANIDAMAGKPVAEGVNVALELAEGALQNQINGENLPRLVEALLRAVLAGELNVSNLAASEAWARQFLKSR